MDTQATGNLYFYNSASNEAEKYAQKITYDQFVHEEIGDNSFWIDPRGDGLICVYYTGEEMVALREDRQTEEQAVILFATMLGMRETAVEELADA